MLIYVDLCRFMSAMGPCFVLFVADVLLKYQSGYSVLTELMWITLHYYYYYFIYYYLYLDNSFWQTKSTSGPK